MKTKSAVKERSIRLTGHEVRAILDGRKTQTRRIIDPQPPASCVYAINGNKDKAICMADDTVDVPERPWFVPPYVNKAQCYVECRYGKLGDRLWVRETWCLDDDTNFHYKADGDSPWDGVKWKPSIHMPRRVSRITLEITDVRVERLNDISRGDCMLEGCPFQNLARGTDPIGWYKWIWESINGEDSWAENPYVWVIEFEKVDA